MPDFLTQVLLGDDNNANIADGTPHWDDICDAFAIHNLPCPVITQYILFIHTPVADQTSDGHPITGHRHRAADGRLRRIWWPTRCGSTTAPTAGPTWSSVVMEPTGAPGEFRPTSRLSRAGPLVTYYLRAVTTTGVAGTLPDRRPRPRRLPVHGRARSVALDSATFETDQGWTVGAPGDAATAGDLGTGRSGGQGERSLVIYQPERRPHGGPGRDVLRYRRAGGGPTTSTTTSTAARPPLLSPIFDFSTASGACKLDFWAFFQNDLAVDDTLRASVSNDGGGTWTDLWKLYGKRAQRLEQLQAPTSPAPRCRSPSQMRFRFQIADYNGSRRKGRSTTSSSGARPVRRS